MIAKIKTIIQVTIPGMEVLTTPLPISWILSKRLFLLMYVFSLGEEWGKDMTSLW